MKPKLNKETMGLFSCSSFLLWYPETRPPRCASIKYIIELIGLIGDAKMLTAIIPRQASNDRDLVNMFLYQRSQRSMNTLRVYKKVVGDFFSLVKKSLGQVTLGDLLSYQHDLANQGLAPATQAQRISAIRSLFSWARKLNYIAFDPSEVVQVPRVTPVSESRYLSKGELEAIIAAAKGHSQKDFLVVSFLALTGVRVSEATTAIWADIFTDPNGHTGLRVRGKGVQSRVVLLPDALWKIVCARRRRLGLAVAIDPNDHRPILATRTGKALSATSVNKIIRRATRAAGIAKRVSAHYLRHGHATAALMAGAPIDLVAASLGHRSIETTRRYLHSSEALDRSSASYIDIEL